MAVYTDIEEDELAAFLAAYKVGGLLSYKGIAEGVENSNFLLHCEDASYILTLYERRVEAADLPFFLGLKRHLAARGISCPLPIERRDGALLGELAGRPAALISFLEGFWLRRPAPAHCREVGAAMARMHAAGEGFALARPNALAAGAWEPLYRAAGTGQEIDAISPGLSREIEAALEAVVRDWPAGSALPEGVIHADLFPDNVFFLHDRLSGLIDFYFACNDLLAYDLAIALNAWCFERDGSFNVTKGRALIAGYEGVRELTVPERTALPVLARGAALRFLLTRLYDWLHIPDTGLVRKKDPLEYLARLRFHAQAGSIEDYGGDSRAGPRILAADG